MYIVVLSRLHIEMAILKVSECMHLHKLCNMHFVHRYDIGWIKVGSNALIQSSISSAGTADSFISVSHVIKTRKAHQATTVYNHIGFHHMYDE